MMFDVLTKKRVFLLVLLAIFFTRPDFSVHAQLRAERGSTAPATDKPPLAKSDTEKRILAVFDDMDRNQRAALNVPVEDARLLRLLTESINAKHVVELGTANGFSGIWLALALQSTGGKLTTFEINPQFIKQARENFKRAGVDQLITVVQGDAHAEVTKLTAPIDLVFIDADKEGYLDYLNKLLPLVRPGGLVVAHDMRMPRPDPRYVDAITTNPDLETVFLNMHSHGIAVTLKKR
jgi:predicted O-methyltransferase YrrM